MEENSLYDNVLEELEVVDEATARDIIRIVRSVLLEHDREVASALARNSILRDSPLAY